MIETLESGSRLPPDTVNYPEYTEVKQSKGGKLLDNRYKT